MKHGRYIVGALVFVVLYLWMTGKLQGTLNQIFNTHFKTESAK